MKCWLVMIVRSCSSPAPTKAAARNVQSGPPDSSLCHLLAWPLLCHSPTKRGSESLSRSPQAYTQACLSFMARHSRTLALSLRVSCFKTTLTMAGMFWGSME